MVDFLSIGRHPGKVKTKRHGGGDPAGIVPFRWLRIYDDSAGKPALPTDSVLGRLLVEIDLTTAMWTGSVPVQLASTLTATPLVMGFPLYMRLVSDDGLTVMDVDYVLPVNAGSPSTEVQEDNPPETPAYSFPGPWLIGESMQFGPGDLVYTP